MLGMAAVLAVLLTGCSQWTAVQSALFKSTSGSQSAESQSEDKEGRTHTQSSKNALSQNASSDSSVDYAGNYGYKLLLKESNANMAKAYVAVAKAMASFQSSINLIPYELTTDELSRIFYYCRNDFPEYFWCSGDYQYKYATNDQKEIAAYLELTFDFDGDATAIKAAQQAVDAETAALLSGMTDSMSTYDKEKLIHDALVKTVSYDDSLKAEHDGDIYGALVKHVAVCEGYARAFQYLLKKAGIQSVVAIGQGTDENGSTASHAWNLVDLDGSYYAVDVTWDDPEIPDKDNDLVFYYYFNVTSAQLSKDHILQNVMNAGGNYQYSVPVPTAAATGLNYYIKNGLELKGLTVDAVAALIADAANSSSRYAQFRSAYTKAQISSFLSAHFSAVQKAVNSAVTDSRYSMTKDIGLYARDSLQEYVLKFC